jgi:hypothetical protein
MEFDEQTKFNQYAGAKRKKRENMIFEEFIEPRENVPSMTAKTDLLHK